MNTAGLRTPVFSKYKVLVNHNDSIDSQVEISETTYRWVNNTSSEVRIKGRMGINQVLKRASLDRPHGYIDLYINWKMTEEAFNATYYDFLDRHAEPDGFTKAIIDAFYRAKDSEPFQGLVYSLQVHFEFLIADIIEAGGTVYVEELDLTICLGKDRRKYDEHPFSKQSRLMNSLAQELPSIGSETFIMSIRAIDNGQLRSRHDRFMMLGSEVYHIPIEKDLRMKEGIHITRRRTADVKNMGGVGQSIEQEHLSFEEADAKYCLFETIEQARAGMSTADLRKEEQAQRAYERSREKADKEHEQWREKSRFEEEVQREKDHRQRRRHFEEEAKENTRNIADWMKLASGIIAAAVALATTVLKLKPA